MNEKAIEAAARALALQARVSEMEARGYNGNHASEYADEWWRSHLDRARHCISAFLQAEAERGMRMVPREATPTMHAAGERLQTLGELRDRRFDTDASAIFAAMFDAATGGEHG